MNRKDYIIFIRNQETQEVKEVKQKAYTVDEAIDKVDNKLEHPWKIAKHETIEHYNK